jgi:hypothetical protein
MTLARIVRYASCGHLMKGGVQTGTGRYVYRCSGRFSSRHVSTTRVGFTGATPTNDPSELLQSLPLPATVARALVLGTG